MPPQQTDILLDVVALVRQGDPLQTAKRALQTRLESNGAKVVTVSAGVVGGSWRRVVGRRPLRQSAAWHSCLSSACQP